MTERDNHSLYSTLKIRCEGHLYPISYPICKAGDQPNMGQCSFIFIFIHALCKEILDIGLHNTS